MTRCRCRRRWNSCMPGSAISSARHAYSAILWAISGGSSLIPLYCEVALSRSSYLRIGAPRRRILLQRRWALDRRHCSTDSGLSQLPCALRCRVWASRTTSRVSNPASEETQTQDEMIRMVAGQLRITRNGRPTVTENEHCTPR
ncbi:uncharacterized protein SCHCODRAFT_02192509 [Schizophyllum commune H4-8]|uniref:Expressed protein n=1 Tax=Schizophyllum commune (strain H4-8 / FGSC 9210) TaxID=578458 RepID=D8PZR8_SCHCM|nr:uncharacterized protein SCHCODRAFT_02192509 [Schizophyllum commune H4-8]KAI5896493.1 hypothetical protein SCHCODRAFT_02192509 [Schizophyllum commune H4-8]